MDSIINLSSSAIIFGHYLNGLIFKPYKTMRKIAEENDNYQLLMIFILVYCYFIYANIIRVRKFHPFVISGKTSMNIFFFGLTMFLATGFFYLTAKFINRKINYKPFLFTFSYSLMPTYIWFFMTSTLYIFFPPPRSNTIPGLLFSAFFFISSLTLLLWKINLIYLAIRFSTKLDFSKIIILAGLFLLWFLPYSYWLYQIKVFRIPFI